MNAQWQPIETAPKDGTAIDVYGKDFDWDCGYRIPECYWSDTSECWKDLSGNYFQNFNATHWMQLPEPPK